MKQYLEAMRYILDNGIDHSDRTGVGRRSVFGYQLRFNLNEGFPLVTTRQSYFRVAIEELLWFIKGSTDNGELIDKNVHIWDNWTPNEKFIRNKLDTIEMTDESKELLVKDLMTKYNNQIGPMYGNIWRNAPLSNFIPMYPEVDESDIASDKLELYKKEFSENKFYYTEDKDKEVDFASFLRYRHYSNVDQLQTLLINLRDRPYSSRHVISAWIPEYIPFENMSPQENVLLGKGCLAPCHVLQQYMVLPPLVEGGKKRLSLMMTQRSSDFCIGSVTNIASYSLLLSMIAHVMDMEPFEFIYSNGDMHIYSNHIETAKEQIKRTPLPLPKLWLNPEVKDLFKFTKDDIMLMDYVHLDKMQYDIAV